MRHTAMSFLLAAFVVGCDTATDSTAPAETAASPALAAARGQDDPGIDRSRLQPELSPGLDWSCHWTFAKRQIVCGTKPAKNFNFSETFGPDQICPNGDTVYSKGGTSLIAKRYYNNDYKVVERVLHWYNHRVLFSLQPDGSGTTARTRGESWVETNDYTVPGSDVLGSATTTVEGTELEITLDAPGHRVLARDKGKIRIDPSGALTIIVGRWDFFTDPERTVRRICSALRGPNTEATRTSTDLIPLRQPNAGAHGKRSKALL